MKKDDHAVLSFGSVDPDIIDWRDYEDVEFDPDEKPMRETPPEVIAVLGFDPLDMMDEDENMEAEKENMEAEKENMEAEKEKGNA